MTRFAQRYTKWIVALAAVSPLLASVGCGGQAPNGPPASAPRIASPEPEFDFGRLPNSEQVEHAFVITNTGDDVLRITEVNTSCGCTVAELSKDGKILEPGQQSEIVTKLSLKDKSGDLSKVIRVRSNDPEKPEFQLTLTGETYAPIALSPSLVNFGTITDDDTHSQTLTVESTEPGLKFGLTNVASSTDHVSLTTKTVLEGERYEVQVATLPGLDPGRLNGVITIQTDHPVYASLEARIVGEILGDYRVNPPSIVLPPATARVSKPLLRQLMVSAGRRTNFKIVKVEVPSEGIAYRLEELGPSSYRIQLSMDDWDGLHGTYVELSTDLSASEKIKIPIRTLETTSIRPTHIKNSN